MPTFEFIDELKEEEETPAATVLKASPNESAPTFEFADEAPSTTAALAESEGGILNTLTQAVAGPTEALVEMGETLKSVGDFVRDKFPAIKELDPGTQFQVPIPQFEEPKGPVASLVKGATQFLTAFLPFSRIVKGIGITGAVAKGATAGALADFTAFDPDDPNLSNTINELAPALRNPLTDFLATEPGDSAAEKRFKRALEGLGLGTLAEGVFRGGKALMAARKAKNAGAIKPVAIPTPDVPPTIADEVVQPTAVDEAVQPTALDEAVQLKRFQRPTAIDEAVPTPGVEAPSPVAGVTAPPTPDIPTTPLLDTNIPVDPDVLPKFAGSVNLERLQTDRGVKQAIIEASEAIPKRDRIGMDEMVKAADSMGFTLTDVDKLAKATTEQRSAAFAARQVSLGTAEAYDQARRTFVESQSAVDFTHLREAETAHLRAFKANQEIASNAGFTLRTFRETASAKTPEDFADIVGRQINKILTQLQEKGPIADEITKRLSGLDKTNPEEVHRFMEFMSTQTATTPDKLFEGFLASILSGPQTHAANTLGNLGTLAIRPLERIATAGVDIFLSPIKPRDRFFGEAAVDVMGMLGGLNSGVRAFSRTMRTGMSSFGTKLETTAPKSEIERALLSLGARAKIGGRAGQIIRTPLRLLSATDEFFKTIAREGDFYAQSYRLGVKKNLKGPSLLSYTTEQARRPTQQMKRAAELEATYRTFTRELGVPGQTVAALRKVPGVRYIMPFVRTPVNIAKFGLERTPLKAFDLFRQAAKGQLSKSGELSEEVGKLAIGMGLMAWTAGQVVSGNVTGTGPTNREDFRALRDGTNWKPNSIRIGDQFFSYSRLEPFATMFGIMADATELTQAGLEAGVIGDTEAKEIVDGVSQMLVRNLSDKTFLQGLSSTSDALHDPGRYGERWLSQRVRAVVPNIIGQASRAQDPVLRKTQGILDSIRGQLPKIGDFEGRQGLFPVRNFFGEPIEQPGNFWFKYMVPIRISDLQAGPAGEIVAEVGARIQSLSRNMTVKNTKIKLNDKQFDRFEELSGQAAKEEVGKLVGTLGTLSKELQQDQVEKAFARGRARGKKQFVFEEFPEVRRKIGDRFQNLLNP
jgi:hypothetical protein